MKGRTLLILLLLTVFSGNAHAAPFDVFVSILPQKYFLQKVGGTHVHVMVLVSPGENPATYEPKPRQMAALSRARAYFSIGVPFEKTWLPRITGLYEKLPIIRTDRGILKEPLQAFQDHQVLQEKEAETGTPPTGLDPHIWTSPTMVVVQARNIANGLARIDPAHRDDYEAKCREFIREVEALDLHIRKILIPRATGKSFLVFHPSWGYFARDYGLQQIAIEREGKAPGPKYLEGLIAFARKRGVRAIFVQPQFSRKSAQIVARAIGARVVSADPLAEDWAQNLMHVAVSLQDTLGP